MFELKGEKCYLKPFSEKELESERYIYWLNDYEVVSKLNLYDYLKPVSKHKIEKYIEGVLGDEAIIFLAIYTRDNEFIGTLKIGMINQVSKTADIGIMIGERDSWGKGYASDAINTACVYCFERLGLRKITSGMMANNVAMQKCFEKLGFMKEGCFRKQDFYEGKYLDHIYMGCFFEEFKRLRKTT